MVLYVDMNYFLKPNIRFNTDQITGKKVLAWEDWTKLTMDQSHSYKIFTKGLQILYIRDYPHDLWNHVVLH